MRRKKILFALLAAIFMIAVNSAMGQSSYEDCSQKYLVNERPPIGNGESHYRRRIVFPWYAVGPTPDGGRWETRLIFGLAAVPPPKDFLGGFYNTDYRSMREKPQWAVAPALKQIAVQQQPHFVGWATGSFGNFPRLGSRQEFILTDFSWWDGNGPHPTNDLDVGIIVLDFYAGEKSNPCEVNKVYDNFAYAQLTFLARRADGTVEWQVSEPGYFTDQLSARWAAPINVSGTSSDIPDFEDPSFAVANAGDQEVKVRISIFHYSGEPSDGRSMPCWSRTITLGPMRTEGHVIRDWFAELAPRCGGENPLFAPLFGTWDTPNSSFGFRGTILFEAVDDSGNVIPDARIIPLVLQRVGDSLTNVQLVKLPPQKPTW